MHCSAESSADQRRAFANAANLLGDSTADVDALVVVLNGDGVSAARADSPVADEVRGLLARTPAEATDADASAVEVCVCGNSLAARDIPEDSLVYGVEVVSSGMGEISRREADGYGYIRVP
ncbi:DsrE family protein [Halobaculum limi]|uniref:DsrE family protein n=1 Tax=Halobaculum limi TaxID=3031916 RepID=UPI0024076C0C|nr:DsrE family protein [Halobaculum sp. YSMS11]